MTFDTFKSASLHGRDPVSMFNGDIPALGNAEFTCELEGVDYYSASTNAQSDFDADPVAHLPQFGVFCAFGVFVGKSSTEICALPMSLRASSISS